MKNCRLIKYGFILIKSVNEGNFMEKILNDSIMPLVSNGHLSMHSIRELISIKEFIDRVSTKKYIIDDTSDLIMSRLGTAPDIITWGDFFQSDLAMVATTSEKEEFDRIIGTVRFDIMSAWDIFSSASPELVIWIREKSAELTGSGKEVSQYTEEEQEMFHLGILHDYFFDLGINGNFYESELMWYHGFFDDQATGTEGVNIQ
jgi:hypothetical protein